MDNNLSPALLVIVRALVKHGHSGTLTAAQARAMTLGDLDDCARLASGRELVEVADGKLQGKTCVYYGDCPFPVMECQEDHPHSKCKYRQQEGEVDNE